MTDIEKIKEILNERKIDFATDKGVSLEVGGVLFLFDSMGRLQDIFNND